ncbi:MAG TPA: glycosyltransferase family 9 protein [Coriobacteriia bacterium]|jgi:ADP-heptose:LPS heptosyltransferase
MLHAPDNLPGVARIAVLKAGGLGDVIFGLPALEALRAAYPSAEIVLLTSRLAAELLRGRPSDADAVLVVPAFEGDEAQAPEARARLEAFCERVRGERFDLALQMHGGGANSNPLTARLGARLTAGLRAPGAPPLDRTAPYVHFQSEVARGLEVAGLVGASAVSLEPRVRLTSADESAAGTALPPDGRPLAVLHPGAGDPRRRWPAAKFAEVGRELAAAGARLAVIGTPPESALTAAIAAAVPSAADLCGALGMRALAGMLGRAAVVVSNDSGPLHLANAVGAATVGVYWCGNLVNAGPATVARHRAFAAWRLECPACGADCMADGCGHDASFVADVPVSEVAAAALELLNASPPRRPV